jgi:hypothetical protein
LGFKHRFGHPAQVLESGDATRINAGAAIGPTNRFNLVKAFGP